MFFTLADQARISRCVSRYLTAGFPCRKRLRWTLKNLGSKYFETNLISCDLNVAKENHSMLVTKNR